MSELDRVRWRCRRGLMELEIILERFLARHYATLTLAERDSFDELLRLPDAEFWTLIGEGRDTPESPPPILPMTNPLCHQLIELLRQC